MKKNTLSPCMIPGPDSEIVLLPAYEEVRSGGAQDDRDLTSATQPNQWQLTQ